MASEGFRKAPIVTMTAKSFLFVFMCGKDFYEKEN